ncbi:MAG: SpoIID/LytB domain-containing protein, partial [Oscillospiraceae bacterium]|nr:SpoIID/LytB domain-containing protein [Oscillospiraceae bacterium]
ECASDHSFWMRVINCLDLEDYVKGVVPYEMSSDWPYEALRAQAVCARTYVVYNQNAYEEYAFDLTDDTECQVYRGVLAANETTDQAVESTRGEYVRYRGKLCEIYYFASDGGASEDGRYMFESDRPYLLGKVDPFENAVDYSFQSWEEWLTGENLSWLLSGKGYEIGYVVRVEPVYSSLGNAVAVDLYDSLGRQLRLTGRDAYTLLHLNNCRYTVERTGDYYWFRGSGWGHNCGMSQWGARAMASVYGYDYQDILRFYYTGVYAA